LAGLTAEEFVAQILAERFGVSGAVIGFNFHFGMRRAGSPDFLGTEGRKYGFTVDVVPRFEDNGRPVSSGPIRNALAAGRVDEAAELLGFPWFVSGRVIHGEKRGRDLGFPTANLGLGEYLRPAFGVYAVRVSGDGADDPLDGKTVDGVANIGLRPTVGGLVPRLEAHLFDIDRDLYGRHLRVALVDFIRPERKFASFGELKGQIAADAARAREILAAEPA